VADILAQLGIQRRVVVSVNGRSNAEVVHLLQDGDQVVVYTPVGGG
jgi:sulfur carrier protein ThiS